MKEANIQGNISLSAETLVSTPAVTLTSTSTSATSASQTSLTETVPVTLEETTCTDGENGYFSKAFLLSAFSHLRGNLTFPSQFRTNLLPASLPSSIYSEKSLTPLNLLPLSAEERKARAGKDKGILPTYSQVEQEKALMQHFQHTQGNHRQKNYNQNRRNDRQKQQTQHQRPHDNNQSKANQQRQQNSRGQHLKQTSNAAVGNKRSFEDMASLDSPSTDVKVASASPSAPSPSFQFILPVENDHQHVQTKAKLSHDSSDIIPSSPKSDSSEYTSEDSDADGAEHRSATQDLPPLPSKKEALAAKH